MIRCPVCESGETEPQGNHVDRRRGIPGEWSVRTCRHCNAGFLWPLPTDQELATYYERYYGESGKAAKSPEANSSRRPHWIRKSIHWLTGSVDPRDFVDFSERDRILDFGCGFGAYMREFAERGASIVGAEYSGEALANVRARGFEAQAISGVKQLPFESESFDVIYAMQVLEHIPEPHDLMREFARISKHTGRIYLAVPNFSSAWRRVFGQNWISGWFVPFHVINYTEKSLKCLADSHGLNIVRSWTKTPLSWFLLNVSAARQSGDNQITGRPLPVLAELVLSCCLRVIELVIKRRDCLVVVMQKA